MSKHIASPKLYLVILSALMFGTVLTVAAAVRDFGPWNIVIALAIATSKATLVVLFFMHAWYSPKRTHLVIVSAVFWLALLIGLTVSDYAMRQHDVRNAGPPPVSRLH